MPFSWKTLFGRSSDAPVVVETMAPVEVPVLTEVKRQFARGEIAYGIRFGYVRALEDAARAYGLVFSLDQTNWEVLRSTMGSNPRLAGQLELFERAYRLYEPVRYGGAVPAAEPFVALLTSLYAAPEMHRLYASVRYSEAPTAAAAPPNPSTPPELSVPPPPPPEEGGGSAL